MNFNGELYFGINLVFGGTITINGDLITTGKMLMSDGKAGAPSLAYSSETTLGFYKNASGQVTFTGNRLILDGDLQVTEDFIIDGDITLNGDLKCEDITCQSITNSGTQSNGTNAQTTGALSTTSISNSGTQSNGTNAQTTGALSCTSLSNSGTSSNGTNAQTTGALSCTSISNSGAYTGSSFTPGTNQILVTTAAGSASDMTAMEVWRVPNGSGVNGNVYGIGIDVFGRGVTAFGVNKTTPTSQIPASYSFLTNYSNSTGLTIGRGGANGLPSFADISINTTGAVSMTNGQVSVASIAIASTSGTSSQTRAVFLGTTNAQTITSSTTASTVTIWSTTATETSGSAITCNGTTFTVPALGFYTIRVTLSGDTGVTALWRMLRVDSGGTKYGTQRVNPPAADWSCSTSANIALAASGTFTIETAQTDGSANSKDIGSAYGPVKITITKSF